MYSTIIYWQEGKKFDKFFKSPIIIIVRRQQVARTINPAEDKNK